MKLAIIGDYEPGNKTHIASNESLQHAAQLLAFQPAVRWIPTETIAENFDRVTKEYDSFLIAPGSPYKDMNAVLEIIRYARVHKKPTLGTCGGFQHMVIEFARNVLDIQDAEHAESSPYASRLVINPLSCNLKGSPLEIRITDKSSAAAEIYGTETIVEKYYCNFGLNPEYQQQLNAAGFKIVGSDNTGEARIMELEDHPFFIATLFVPQTSSTTEHPNKMITAFLKAGMKTGRVTTSIVPANP